MAEYFETGCFGELALVYNAPRAATVRTTEECDLYSLDVGSFRHVLREQAGARETQHSTREVIGQAIVSSHCR